MNSFNHYAYGAVGDWLYQVVAGLEVDPDAPGYKRILIQPQPDGGLTYARAALVSIYGRIESKWELDNGIFKLAVTIPPNSNAVLHLPLTQVESVTEQGNPLNQVEGIIAIDQENNNLVLTLGSGSYYFTVE
ncbi:MAG: alpha-L-rhamnosidase C-terminal domain-containing protein [Candidatus Promineifilaceae bacterium]